VLVVVVVVVVVVFVVVVVGLIISIPTILSLFSSVDCSEATFQLPVRASYPLVVMVWMSDRFVAMRLQLQATPEDNMLRKVSRLFAVSLYKTRPLRTETFNVAHSIISEIYLLGV